MLSENNFLEFHIQNNFWRGGGRHITRLDTLVYETKQSLRLLSIIWTIVIDIFKVMSIAPLRLRLNLRLFVDRYSPLVFRLISTLMGGDTDTMILTIPRARS